MKEVLRDHLKAYIRVARDQLNPAIQQEDLFEWFDKEIEKQLAKLEGGKEEGNDHLVEGNKCDVEYSLKQGDNPTSDLKPKSKIHNPNCERCTSLLCKDCNENPENWNREQPAEPLLKEIVQIIIDSMDIPTDELHVQDYYMTASNILHYIRKNHRIVAKADLEWLFDAFAYDEFELHEEWEIIRKYEELKKKYLKE